MTPARLAECLALLRWSQRGLADALNVPDSTVRGWCAGRSTLPQSVAQWLDHLARIHARHQPPKDFA